MAALKVMEILEYVINTKTSNDRIGLKIEIQKYN